MDKAQVMAHFQCVLIAGPTASGKSALAMDLAKTFNGVVINADSMQVYRGLRILTNRPSRADEAEVPHRLYGIRPLAEAYSTALWLADLECELQKVRTVGQLPIVVGGTGLYFKALTEGLSAIPPIPSDIRAHYRKQAEEQPPEMLHLELSARDPEMAKRLKAGDKQRIARALEVLEATGRSLFEWQQTREPALVPLRETFPIVLSVDRAALYARCDARFDALMAQGALEEASEVASLGLHRDLPGMRAVGLRELMDHLAGKLSLEEAVREAKTSTRQYAKRQVTWVSNNFISWNYFYLEQMERIKRELDNYLKYPLTAVEIEDT